MWNGILIRTTGFPYSRCYCLDHYRQHGVGQFRVDRQRQRFGGGAFARWQVAGTLSRIGEAFLMEIENINRYSPLAVELMEIEH
jgi:hypothetical protein